MLLVWMFYRFKVFKPEFIKKAMVVIAIIEVGTSCIVTVEQKSYHDWENYYINQPQYEELNSVAGAAPANIYTPLYQKRVG